MDALLCKKGLRGVIIKGLEESMKTGGEAIVRYPYVSQLLIQIRVCYALIQNTNKLVGLFSN